MEDCEELSGVILGVFIAFSVYSYTYLSAILKSSSYFLTFILSDFLLFIT